MDKHKSMLVHVFESKTYPVTASKQWSTRWYPQGWINLVEISLTVCIFNSVKYTPPKLLRQNYIHFIYVKKGGISEVDWYESRTVHWSHVGVKLEKLKLRTVPKHFCSVIFWRVCSQIRTGRTGRNKKKTVTVAIELFVIYNYRNETRILFSKLQIFLLSLFSCDGNRWLDTTRPDFNLSCNHVSLKLFCWSLCRGLFSQ